MTTTLRPGCASVFDAGLTTWSISTRSDEAHHRIRPPDGRPTTVSGPPDGKPTTVSGRPTAGPPPYPGRPTAGADRALRAFPTSVVAGDRYFKSYIAAQVETHGADNVSVYGDSAGGTLAMLAVQKIVRDCGNDAECLETSVPTRMVLLSPSLGRTTIYDDPNVVLVDDPVTSIPKPGDPPDWQGDTTDDRLWNPMAGQPRDFRRR